MKKHLRTVCLVAVAATMMTACKGGGESTEWVDLGLPSGLLWATCNVGANAPEEAGNYYAWGETEPKDVYNWSTYKNARIDEDEMRRAHDSIEKAYGDDYDNFSMEIGGETRRYDSIIYEKGERAAGLEKGAIVEAKTENDKVLHRVTLNAAYDAVAQVIGDGARMPSVDEWDELMENTTRKKVQVNGVDGIQYTAANGNSIFVPIVPMAVDSIMDYCLYPLWGIAVWSVTADDRFPCYADVIRVYEEDYTVMSICRANGLPVRAVREGRKK